MYPTSEQLNSEGVRPGDSGTFGATKVPSNHPAVDTKAILGEIRADRDKDVAKAREAKEIVAGYTRAKEKYNKENPGK